MYQMSTNDIGTWDDFLGYDSGGLGSGGKTFLENWKKGGKGSADVWLYVGKVSAPVPPRPLWHHPWHKIEVRENKETHAPVRELWSDRIVSADPNCFCRFSKSSPDSSTTTTDSGCPR